jgi:hypothetical protein
MLQSLRLRIRKADKLLFHSAISYPLHCCFRLFKSAGRIGYSPRRISHATSFSCRCGMRIVQFGIRYDAFLAVHDPYSVLVFPPSPRVRTAISGPCCDVQLPPYAFAFRIEIAYCRIAAKVSGIDCCHTVSSTVLRIQRVTLQKERVENVHDRCNQHIPSRNDVAAPF